MLAHDVSNYLFNFCSDHIPMIRRVESRTSWHRSQSQNSWPSGLIIHSVSTWGLFDVYAQFLTYLRCIYSLRLPERATLACLCRPIVGSCCCYISDKGSWNTCRKMTALFMMKHLIGFQVLTWKSTRGKHCALQIRGK